MRQQYIPRSGLSKHLSKHPWRTVWLASAVLIAAVLSLTACGSSFLELKRLGHVR